MDPSREALVRDLSDGIDLNRRRNYMQLAAGASVAVGGAVLGFCNADERSDLAAIAGALLGFVAGIFLAGLAIMFRPAPKISVEAAVVKRKNLERRLWRLLVVWVLTFMCGPLIILPCFGHDDRPWAFVLCIAWFCTVTGLCAYLKMKKAALEQFAKEIDGQQAERQEQATHST
jgi:drug/metabolite transporter (DMT)-like permease